MADIIEFKNVTKEFRLGSGSRGHTGYIIKSGKRKVKTALDSVSFSIQKGERVAVIGKDGSGKTTLMKMIQGTCYPTRGEVIVRETPSFMLDHTSGFDGDFTGRENLYLRGKLMGVKRSIMEEKESEIVGYAELGEYIDQPLRLYSGSMKVKLGYAMDVILRPDIILADESISVGEGDFREKAMKSFLEIINDETVTFVFATHSSAGARKYCTRGIVINEGRVFFDGDIEEAVAFYRANFSGEKPKKKKSKKKTGAKRATEVKGEEKTEKENANGDTLLTGTEK